MKKMKKVTTPTYGAIIMILKMTTKESQHRLFTRDRGSILKSMPGNEAMTAKPKKWHPHCLTTFTVTWWPPSPTSVSRQVLFIKIILIYDSDSYSPEAYMDFETIWKRETTQFYFENYPLTIVVIWNYMEIFTCDIVLFFRLVCWKCGDTTKNWFAPQHNRRYSMPSICSSKVPGSDTI